MKLIHLITINKGLVAFVVVLQMAVLNGCKEANKFGLYDAETEVPLTPVPAEKSVDTPVITLTPRAAARVQEIISRTGIGDFGSVYLRVRVTPGGCTGVLYDMKFETEITKRDYTMESEGVKVAIYEVQKEMLSGTELDFGEKDGEKGFLFECPNLKGKELSKWIPILKDQYGVE